MRIHLSEEENIVLSAAAVRRLVASGSSDAAMLYLTLLLHHGSLSPEKLSGEEKAALAVLKNMPYVTEDTIIIVEAVLDRDFSWVTELGFTITKDKRYKTNKHIFMKREV